MAKPAGPACNLDCTYCFYTEKTALFPKRSPFRMSESVLEEFIRQYIETASLPELAFAWQGGEPTILGVDYFREIVRLQKKYAGGKTITNAIQTNGVLLDDEWARFLSEYRFLVGISIDGPQRLHDAFRRDAAGNPSFGRVMKGLETLKRHNVEFNTLTVVNLKNVRHPLEVYGFLKDIGSRFHQYIPLVEREPDSRARELGLSLAAPSDPGKEEQQEVSVTEWSVRPESYGRFLIAVFDEWVRHDVGSIFVQQFDNALSAWFQGEGSLCVYRETCGDAMVIEHDGTVYSCDHFVYPEYALGNILEQDLAILARSGKQRAFGEKKRDALPSSCRECEFLFACHGGCPKHRFTKTPDGEPYLNYLCEGYRLFFRHAAPYMETMCSLLENRRPPSHIMEMLKERESSPAPKRKIGRNDPCPCGSGKKYKHCHGRIRKKQ